MKWVKGECYQSLLHILDPLLVLLLLELPCHHPFALAIALAYDGLILLVEVLILCNQLLVIGQNISQKRALPMYHVAIYAHS